MQKFYGKVAFKEGIGSVGSIPFANAGLKVRKVRLSAATIKALNTTPATLVPSPGANKVVIPEMVVMKNTFAGGAFAGNNGIDIRYTDANGAAALVGAANTFTNISANTALVMLPKNNAAVVPVANAAVVAHVAANNPTGANATGYIDVITFYRIVAF